MSTPALAQPSAALIGLWRWSRPLLFLIALVPRLYVLTVYNVELSQDGFEAVNTLRILQTQGAGAVSRELIDRFILHPLYMLLLYALRLLTPASVDFYFAARLLSTLIACVAVLILFELVRRGYSAHGDLSLYAAWAAALLLAFAPTFVWESAAILSSTLFLALYLGVLLALESSRYRLAALLAFLSAITRYEGAVLVGLVLLVVAYRDLSERRLHVGDWAVSILLTLAVPLVLAGSGWLTTGNALEFLGAQSMASLWLRFLAPGDFSRHAAFFLTQYPALLPLPVVVLGIAGAIVALARYRRRTTALLLLTSALYLAFFEVLVWFDYTTLEVRFLMYPGLPLIVFTGIALASVRPWLSRVRYAGEAVLAAAVCVLVILSYQQADAGIRFVYNMMASQREMADELAHIIPPNRETRLLAYTGTSGALDFYGQARGLRFTYTDFRFAPDDNPERFIIDRKIDYVIYPVGNAFAKAKYPYLARFETQTHGPVTFQALTQFATSTDNQLYSIWSVAAAP